MIHLVMSSWFIAVNTIMTNSCVKATNSNAKPMNSIAYRTNSTAKAMNATAKAMNSTVNGTKSIAKTVKTRKHLQAVGYRSFLKITKTRIFVCQPACPDHSHKAGSQMKQHTATILCHNNKLTSVMCFLMSVCPLFLLSSMYVLLHVMKPY